MLCFLSLAVLTTSCESFTGGGWIYSKAGQNAKATFGFTVTCTDDGVGGSSVEGTMEYQDHGWTVGGGTLRLHGVLDQTHANATCEQLDALETIFLKTNNLYSGTYVTQPPKAGAGGNFLFQVTDNGASGDTLGIVATSGLYSGYSNSGVLQGGNITLQP
jgi:hypothetical protein